MAKVQETPAVPFWIAVAGAAFSGVTLAFLMALVLMATLGREIPCTSRFLIVAVLAFGAALGSAFLGGSAAAKGEIPLPFAKEHPFQFSAAGGVAVLFIMLFTGNALFNSDACERAPIPKPPVIPVDGPHYKWPTLQGRAIDACIKSYLFPEFQSRQCSDDAQRIIATAFCVEKGYAIAVRWEWQDTGKFHHSYKLHQEREQDGTVQPRWIIDETGGAVLTLVDCA